MRVSHRSAWGVFAVALFLLVSSCSDSCGGREEEVVSETGSARFEITDNEGQPFSGLTVIVGSGESEYRGETGDDGMVTLEGIPVGSYPVAVEYTEDPTLFPAGIDIDPATIRFDFDFVIIILPDGTIIVVRVRFDIHIKPPPPPPPVPPANTCKSRPWCGAAATNISPGGQPGASIGAGVHGDCACTYDADLGGAVSAGNCNPTWRSGLITPAAGDFSVTSRTCLGGPECEVDPGAAVTCDVRVPVVVAP